MKLAHKKREVFAVLFLNNRHSVILYEEVFKGNVNAATVHPRIVAQKALEYNATSIIIAHNHPSSETQPSASDIEITSRLIKTLNLIDVHIIDHIIVGKKDCLSFAENALLSCK